MGPLKLSPLITEEQIRNRVAEIGAEITKKFKGKELIAVSVLKGSFMFYADLIREIDSDIICEFFGVSSYHNSHKSSGEVKLTMDLNSAVEDKHILLIEDIVDTGLTMNYLHQNISARKPASITSATLLSKPGALKVDCKVDHVGFEIANDFVVGYGLDYQGFYRHLPYIAQVQNMN